MPTMLYIESIQNKPFTVVIEFIPCRDKGCCKSYHLTCTTWTRVYWYPLLNPSIKGSAKDEVLPRFNGLDYRALLSSEMNSQRPMPVIYCIDLKEVCAIPGKIINRHGPLVRYVKLRVAHSARHRERFPSYHGLAIPTCITARAWHSMVHAGIANQRDS